MGTSEDKPKVVNKNDVYYYGMSIKSLKEEPYQVVLVAKLALAKAMYHKLIMTDSLDKNRIQDVYKAVEFNTRLLKEIGFENDEIMTSIASFTVDNEKILKELDLTVPEQQELSIVIMNNLKQSLSEMKAVATNLINAWKFK